MSVIFLNFFGRDLVNKIRDIDRPTEVLKAEVPGHAPYDLTILVPLYGIGAAKKMAAVFPKALRGLRSTTGYNYFQAWRRFMLQGGLAAEGHSPSSAMFRLIREGRENDLSKEQVEAALHEVYHRIANLNDFSFAHSANDKSRAGMWDGVRRFCSLLARAEYLPPFAVSGTIRFAPGTRTPVFADLARDAGRLPPCNSWKEAEEQALKANIELMQLLRDELQREFIEELQLFREGQSIVEDDGLLTPYEIDEILSKEGKNSEKLGSNDSNLRIKLALRLFYAMVYNDYRCKSNKYAVGKFLAAAGGQKTLSRYLGATPKALHAAFVIILIDTGWNLQPTTDLQRAPFVGRASRGKRKIKSVGSVKFRADSTLVSAALTDYPAVEAELSVKAEEGRLSGVSVIELWLEVTRPLREKADTESDGAARWLWIWREQFNGVAKANLNSVDKDWWYSFLKRHHAHPRLGGLPITHRVIRKTFTNIAAAQGVFNIRLPMALADHASKGTTQQYLTETTLHSVYAAKMRKFIELWESLGALNIEDAARHLGVSNEDLQKRQQLGLASGLEFAVVEELEASIGDGTLQVQKEDRVFAVSDRDMEKLHLARLALRQRGSLVQFCNPGRWLRSWLLWQVIVDGYCERIEGSRHRARFRRAVQRVECRLASRTDALPLVF